MTSRLVEIARMFLKLGAIGFGGPAAHIALLEEEAVKRRGWVTREEFLDLVGATNLIPGPNSTEMAMHVGYRRAGFAGLVVAGVCFVLPAILITGLLAYVYVQLGQLPKEQVEPILDGIKPAVIAIIVGALWRLARKALKTTLLGIIACGVMVAAVLMPGFEVQVLLLSSVLGMFLLVAFPSQPPENREEKGDSDSLSSSRSATMPLALTGGGATAAAGAGASAAGASLVRLTLFFLKVGAVLYGSGYVLIAYLRGGLVEDLGWLTEGQLLDAIAVGQFTPGPILSTATFIGFVVMCPEPGGDVAAGMQGALLASLAIFLPSFLFVAALGPIIPRLRKNRWASRFLDAVNAASIGLMAAVTLALCHEVLFQADDQTGQTTVRWPSVIIAGTSVSLLFRWKLSPAWLVVFGAVAGRDCQDDRMRYDGLRQAVECNEPIRTPTPQIAFGARASAPVSAGLRAAAEQREPLAHCACRRLQRRDTCNRLWKPENRSQDRPGRLNADFVGETSYAVSGPEEAARRQLRIGGTGTGDRFAAATRVRVRPPHCASDWQRTSRTDR